MADAPQNETVAASPGPIICREPADLYSARSRRIVARLCREFLDSARLTPTELLHSPASQRQYLERGTDYQAVVQKAAMVQAKPAGQDVAQRVRELYGVVDNAVREALKRIEAKPPPPLNPATFAEFVVASRKAELTEVHDFLVNAALATYLAGAKSWMEKIDRLRALADTAGSPSVLALVDAIAAEFVDSYAAMRNSPGRPPISGSSSKS